MKRHILGKRYREIKAHRKIAVALLKAINLLFCFAAALRQQHLGRFQNRRVKRIEAIERIGIAQGFHHALHLRLPLRQQLHEAGQRSRFNLFHS